MNALEIKNLTKSFPDFKLDGITLTLPSGCIMGLIGENGAGKSTTIKLILDMIHKDSGTVTIFGKDNGENLELLKEDIGVVFDEVGLPGCLNALQVEKIMGYTYKNWESKTFFDLLNKMQLPLKKPISDFSRGMKMKISIAIALSHKSRLLLLDEPTGGLDPVARDDVVEMLMDFTRDENCSVLISSHIVSDLEKLCDYIAFLRKGKLMLCEEKDVLLGKYGLINCTAEQLAAIDSSAVIHKKSTPYGITAVALRSAVPENMSVIPISIEELFIYMAKEEV